jgi:predicted amidohydrolase YtcJ
MKPETIVTNARVLTMDATLPRAEAVAVGAGRITAVGGRAEVEALAGPGTRVVDAGGATLLPGFVESHMHLALGGLELGHLQLGGVHGAEALAQAVRSYAAAHPDAPIVLAQGCDYAILGRPPTRADLDAILPDRPLALTAADHHTAWANTAALRAAGILHGARLPAGHEVVMGADGLATGELREFEAFAPVLALSGETRLRLGIATGGEPDPWPDAALRAVDREAVAAGLAHAARHGITQIVNMDGHRYLLVLLRELQAAGRLTARVKVPFHFKPQMDLAELDRASAMAAEFDDAWLSSGFVKMFMDGVIDSGTAFLLEDYADAPGQRGAPLFAPDRFAAICTEADRRGLQIAVHAIGDAAVRATLDGFAAARAANGPRDARHRIEHIELIHPDDIPRLAELGVTASLQPSHPPGAMDFPLEPTLGRIGRARWPHAYLWRTLRDAGAPLAFASDWPVADIDVLRSVQAALTRKPYEGAADERIGLLPTLAAYTAGGAWAAHREHVTGTIRAGRAADLVLLGGDIEATPPEAVAGLGVRLTMAGGRIVHEV